MYLVSDEEMIAAINTSYSRRQALVKCGLTPYGGSYKRVTKFIENGSASLLVKPFIIVKRKKKIKKTSKRSIKVPRVSKTKIDWPNENELTQMIINQSISSLSKVLGVSDNAIRNRAKKYGINIHAISKWSKRHASSF